jgi:hypothetical protein
MAAFFRQQEWACPAAFVQARAKVQVARLEWRPASHPGPAESLILRRVDSPPRPADSDFLNLRPPLTSVSVFPRVPHARAKLPGRVMPQKLAPALALARSRELQSDLPVPVFSRPNREA